MKVTSACKLIIVLCVFGVFTFITNRLNIIPYNYEDDKILQIGDEGLKNELLEADFISYGMQNMKSFTLSGANKNDIIYEDEKLCIYYVNADTSLVIDVFNKTTTLSRQAFISFKLDNEAVSQQLTLIPDYSTRIWIKKTKDIRTLSVIAFTAVSTNYEVSCDYFIEGSSLFKRIGKNTIKSNRTIDVLLLNEMNTVLMDCNVEKGKEYVIPFNAVKYKLLNRRAE